MKKIDFTILLCLCLLSFEKAFSQSKEVYNLFSQFQKQYNSGDLINAKNTISLLLRPDETIPLEYRIFAYNNLGVVYNQLGNYKESLENYDVAEKLILENKKELNKLAKIYINKGRIYNILEQYEHAIEYLEKGIRLSPDDHNSSKEDYNIISTAYLNLGISYLGIKDYETAEALFQKASEIKKKHDLLDQSLPYLNIAIVHEESNNPVQAEKFYKRSIEAFIKRHGPAYYRLADAYTRFGLFLVTHGRDEEGLSYLKKALESCQINYGTKHPGVSLAFKNLGQYYHKRSDYNTALHYYQKAITALVIGFDDENIFANPPLDSVLLDIDLLKILQEKSACLLLFAEEQNNTSSELRIMEKSLETIELAILLIDKIRDDYLSDESRLYLTQNEKETYFAATQTALKLNKLTGNPYYVEKMYTIARDSKAAILRNAISENEKFYTIGFPDSIQENYRDNQLNLAAYNHLIHQEVRKVHPDRGKIDVWKDAVFEMKRDKERLEARMSDLFPQYSDLLKKAEPISLREIQSKLKKNEFLLEFFLSNHFTSEGRVLYAYTVSRDGLNFYTTHLDSAFMKDLNTVKKENAAFSHFQDPLTHYKKYTSSLHAMYKYLILPVEKHLASGKLIIIPDEELAYLPFDAFIKSPVLHEKVDYKGLDYLLRTYSISYGYTSSLLFNSPYEAFHRNEVYAFSPKSLEQAEIIQSMNLADLPGAVKEIQAIFQWFHGKRFNETRASERNFKEALKNRGIFHLAMHSSIDSTDSRYSYLIFNTENDTLEDGNLYHYEVSLSRIVSPMVVLSACNTASGNLYHGEGIMSLARAFLLGGASSVVKTFWDINDEVSSEIIIAFYHYLSQGKEKDEALRLAKLNYLENTHPSYSSPYFWAAYQMIGNKEALEKNKNNKLLLMGVLILLISTGILLFYFKRRRIFPALS